MNVSAFRDRDLYPFCFNLSDGKIVAIGNPNTKGLLGLDRETLKGAPKDLAWTSTPRRRSRKVKLLRSATCL